MVFQHANITFFSDMVASIAKMMYLCDMKKYLILPLALVVGLFFQGCQRPVENPNQPNAILDFVINLTDPMYYNLNWIGNYMYLTSDEQSNSRGLIVYRYSQDEFRVYDRLPPNKPNTCCENGVCSRLVVDVPFVVDSCNMIWYNILNGEVWKGDGVFPLYYYRYSYDGQSLRIRN